MLWNCRWNAVVGISHYGIKVAVYFILECSFCCLFTRHYQLHWVIANRIQQQLFPQIIPTADCGYFTHRNDGLSAVLYVHVIVDFFDRRIGFYFSFLYIYYPGHIRQFFGLVKFVHRMTDVDLMLVL